MVDWLGRGGFWREFPRCHARRTDREPEERAKGSDRADYGQLTMTHRRIHHGEILDLAADGLNCSANIQLNLSGGVGGAILQRYGNEMQTLLHQYLRDRGIRHVEPGECILTPPCGAHFRVVAHAVAIDGFYDTSADLIERTYQNAFTMLAEHSCSTIVAACLGCGYGRFPASEFAKVIARMAGQSCAGLNQITLVTTNAELSELIGSVLHERKVIS
jgi:O-acetyl-ADP-ribose deacetylase